MFHLITGIYELLTREREYSVLVLGIDGAGKTTLCERLRSLCCGNPMRSAHEIRPTVGLNLYKTKYKDSVIVFSDLGGSASFRSVWSEYFATAHMILFVIDELQQQRHQEQVDLFRSMLHDPRCRHISFCLVFSKQDLLQVGVIGASECDDVEVDGVTRFHVASTSTAQEELDRIRELLFHVHARLTKAI
jgi:ADP-ribosylation factor related protein 1